MTRELTIDGRRIADDTDCYVIAEIGHNHQGDLDKARQLFLRAKECGVDAVKLQKRDNRSLYTADMYTGRTSTRTASAAPTAIIASSSSSAAASTSSCRGTRASSG